jgi:hypothetical protein
MLAPRGNDEDLSGHRLLADDAAGPSVALSGAALGQPSSDDAPSALELLRANPYYCGYLRKKRERCFGLCASCFKPSWNRWGKTAKGVVAVALVHGSNL